MTKASTNATATSAAAAAAADGVSRYNILLTGASGYLGQHILAQLLSQLLLVGTNASNDGGEDSELSSFSWPNHPPLFHVYALYGGTKDGFPAAVQEWCDTRQISRDEMEQHVTVEPLDLTDVSAVTAWFAKRPPGETMHACIHAAALSSPRVCQDDPVHAQQLNVPTHFFEQLRHVGQCPCMIALSTDQVYDGNPAHAPYCETDEAEPVNTYGTTKLAMEKVLLDLFDTKSGKGERASAAAATPANAASALYILRSSIILGPKAPIFPAHETFLHFCAGRDGIPTDFYSDEMRSVIFVQDVVRVIVQVLKIAVDALHEPRQPPPQQIVHDEPTTTRGGGGGGIYNMGGPQPVSRVDMAQRVFDHLGYQSGGAEMIIRARRKATLPPGPVPSPLDITMNTSKLERFLWMNRTKKNKFADLDAIVQSTFPR